MPRGLFFALFIALFSLIALQHALGQTSIWNDATNTKKEAAGKLSKGKNRLKAYKDQLKKWGLDTSYRHALYLGGSANTDGWSGRLQYLTKEKGTKSSIWSVTFSEIKHEKQIKQLGTNKSFQQLGNPSPFVFGKINNLYTLQLGYGKEKMLLPGILDGNISVKFRYNGGFSLAMLKPYYLKLIYVDYSQPGQPAYIKEEKYSSANSDAFLNTGDILGASTWSKGLDEIQYVPGAYFELAFVLEPAQNKTFVQLISFGANASVYTKALAIMADAKAYTWQANMFVGLSFGKRWK